jgi:hypothetical protein
MTSSSVSHNEEDRKTLNKKLRKVQWQQAAKDPALLKDIADIEKDFKSTDAETVKRLDD